MVQAGSSSISIDRLPLLCAMAERGLQAAKVWIGSLRHEVRTSRIEDWLCLEGFESDEILDVWVHTSHREGVDSYAFVQCASEEVRCN